ncbi:phage baseplate assembly protein [Crenobacter caeni]|uniref:Baseplate protein n=1 Tax=Crenobacter caeni TaxID=2705474 RepID=A0A6B2KND1_9NEIS|nr:baseplate protein [Crenobacter caeni]NDV11680.1 baseplate protein [Crenobacter caeni]
MNDKRTEPLDPATRVSLTVNGLSWEGWTNVEIGAGLDDQCRSFTVGITRLLPGGDEPVPIVHGDRCELRIGNDLVLTGWVFATPRAHDKNSTAFGIAGRSLTADLVDCAALNKPPQFKRQSVRAIVAALAAPYGIAVLSEVGDGDTVADHTLQPGETAFESIDRLLKISRLISTDDAQGRLVLAAPGSAGRAYDPIQLGRNVLAGDASFDFAGCFSEYRVLGQHGTSANRNGAAANEIAGIATDSRITRKRVATLTESGNLTPGMAKERASWERDNRIGKALAAQYEVAGWRQSNGALWRHNQIVHVIDPILGFDRDMLITAVTYRMDEQGSRVTLAVAPPEGYLPQPPDPEKSKKARKKKGDKFEYLLPSEWRSD